MTGGFSIDNEVQNFTFKLSLDDLGPLDKLYHNLSHPLLCLDAVSTGEFQFVLDYIYHGTCQEPRGDSHGRTLLYPCQSCDKTLKI